MPNTTFNPSDKTASITLSGANLIATVNSASAAGVRSIDSLGSGKFYWEYTGTSFWGGFGVLVGVANASAVLSTVAATPVNAAVVTGAGGGIYVNSSVASGSSLGAQSTGAVIGLALDLSNKMIWLRNAPSGNWNGSGTANPATNTGGLSISSLGTPLYGLMCANTGLTNVVVTANFGDSAFSGAVPSGFTSGFPLGGSGAGGAAQARVMVMA